MVIADRIAAAQRGEPISPVRRAPVMPSRARCSTCSELHPAACRLLVGRARSAVPEGASTCPDGLSIPRCPSASRMSHSGPQSVARDVTRDAQQGPLTPRLIFGLPHNRNLVRRLAHPLALPRHRDGRTDDHRGAEGRSGELGMLGGGGGRCEVEPLRRCRGSASRRSSPIGMPMRPMPASSPISWLT